MNGKDELVIVLIDGQIQGMENKDDEEGNLFFLQRNHIYILLIVLVLHKTKFVEEYFIIGIFEIGIHNI